jgi:hypothetical protein
LLLILFLMIFSAVNALFGERIKESASQFCTRYDLWCAPPTPTPTPTPTLTPTPPGTPAPSPTLTPTGAITLTPAP